MQTRFTKLFVDECILKCIDAALVGKKIYHVTANHNPDTFRAAVAFTHSIYIENSGAICRWSGSAERGETFIDVIPLETAIELLQERMQGHEAESVS